MITAGHRLEDIRTYTLRQVQGFVELAQQRSRYDLEMSAYAMRAAYHADKKGWKGFLKELNSDV